jgi:hypothetical protein
MRKVLLLSAAASVLFVGSIFMGVAAATTGAPVLYDARSPQPRPQATAGAGFGVEAGEAPDGEAAVPDDVDEADASDGAPIASPPVDTAQPSPTQPPPPPTVAPGTGVPDDLVPTLEEQEAWLAFQQVVRECMAEAGHEYRYWEWWNVEPRDPQATEPAVPEELTAAASAAWQLALHGRAAGDTPAADVAGCWGEALESAGEQRRTMAPQPDASPTDPPATPAP